jgi:dihydrorhizobitoxine desaturase
MFLVRFQRAMVMYLQATTLGSGRYQHHRFSRDIERQIKELAKLDNWHSLLALASDYAIIVLCAAACVGLSWWLYPIAIVIIGARQRGISSILHESSHGVSARAPLLRAVLGTVLTAYPIFQTFHAYKISHVLTHHPQLGRESYDADLQFFIKEGVFEPQPPRRYFLRVILLPLFGGRTWAYFKYLLRNRLSAADQQSELNIPRPVSRWRRLEYIAFGAYWAAVLALCAHFGVLLYLALFWVIPYLTFFQIIGWYIELTEHCTVISGQQDDILMASNRHSTGLERFLTGIHNDHHHLDHHLNPSTPFWNLPKAREIRLQDPVYAEADQRTGGLFTRGHDGAPSGLRQLLDQNRSRYQQVA